MQSKFKLAYCILLIPILSHAVPPDDGAQQPAAVQPAASPPANQDGIAHPSASAPIAVDSQVGTSRALYNRLEPAIKSYATLKLNVNNTFNPQPRTGMNIQTIDPLTILAAADTAIQQSKSIFDILSIPFTWIPDIIYNHKNYVGYKKEIELVNYIQSLCFTFTDDFATRKQANSSLTLGQHADHIWKDEYIREIPHILNKGKRATGEQLWLKVSKVFVRTRSNPHVEFVLFLLENSDRSSFPEIEYFLYSIFKQMDLLLQDPKYKNERAKRVK